MSRNGRAGEGQAVEVGFDQLPGGQGQGVEVGRAPLRRGGFLFAAHGDAGDAGDGLCRAREGGVADGEFGFSHHHGVEAGGEGERLAGQRRDMDADGEDEGVGELGFEGGGQAEVGLDRGGGGVEDDEVGFELAGRARIPASFTPSMMQSSSRHWMPSRCKTAAMVASEIGAQTAVQAPARCMHRPSRTMLMPAAAAG
ncbi:MAG: hypothetical protein MZV65_38295 [Chromatiales bacterium]|nr:hypothetical protein [Chromatiales bacterium]